MLGPTRGGLFSFGYITGNVLATRPAGTLGAAITPGNNTYGSYAQVLSAANVARDLYGLLICFNAGAGAGSAARDIICTVGVDPAGGTSYTDTIPHLLASNANNMAGARYYYFPLWVKAGSTVAVKASVNNATVGTINCWMQGYGDPTDQRMVRVGTRVEAVGAVTGSSCGTSVTPGTTSEGSWTDLGALTNDAWWFQTGFGINNGTMALLTYAMDLGAGDATNKDILLQDILVATTGSETVAQYMHLGPCGRDVKAGEHLYGRMQCSGTPDSGISQAAYALS